MGCSIVAESSSSLSVESLSPYKAFALDRVFQALTVIEEVPFDFVFMYSWFV